MTSEVKRINSHHRVDFIVGMSRSGTTWLSKTLNEHPDVSVIGETIFWGRGFIPPKNGETYSSEELKRVALQFKKTKKLFFGSSPGCWKNLKDEKHFSQIIDRIIASPNCNFTPESFFSFVLKSVAEVENKSRSVEKTPHHIKWVDRILSYYPKAKFIVSIRDPYDFMLSYKHQGDRLDPKASEKFTSIWHPFICSLVWRGYARAVIKYSQKYKDNLFILRLENLKKQNYQCVNSVCSFLELEMVDELHLAVPPDSSSFIHASKPCLSSIDIFWMNLVSKKEILRLDYSVKPSNFRLIDSIKSIFKLPVVLKNIAFRLYTGKVTSRKNIILYIYNWLH